MPYLCVSLITMLFRFGAEHAHLIPLDEIEYTPFHWKQAVLRLLLSGVEGQYYFSKCSFSFFSSSLSHSKIECKRLPIYCHSLCHSHCS